jgi:hypothetical protein
VLFRWTTIVTGVWLMLAPAVLHYGDPAAANDRLVGPAVAGSAFVAIWAVLRPVRWVAAPFGLWLLIAPFVLGYDDRSALLSSVIAGAVVLITTPPGRADPDQFGGGWRSLWSSGLHDSS